jgi:outer membrane phospholipase A
MTMKAHKVHDNTKVMLNVFFDHEVLHNINMLEEQIINQHFYLEVLRCIHGRCTMNSRKSVSLASSKFTTSATSKLWRQKLGKHEFYVLGYMQYTTKLALSHWQNQVIEV